MRYRLRTLLIALALVPPLIAWLSIPYLRGRYSKQAIAKQRLAVLQDAIQMYCLDVGDLPAGLDDLTRLPAEIINPFKWQGPYLEWLSVPLDPWGQAFGYKIISHPKVEFEIWSNGPDMKSGTNDDVRIGP